MNDQINVREAADTDSDAIRALLNEIIDVGGTTAIENQLSAIDFNNYFLRGPEVICCFVAVNHCEEVLGFQSLEKHSRIPPSWADIATFARMTPKTPGVGTALFTKTLAFAQNAGVEFINATIRADNVSGLAYYSKMGFVDYAVEPAVPLQDGTPIDRISRKLTVAYQHPLK